MVADPYRHRRFYALQQKLEETNKLYDELCQLTAVKSSMENLEKATYEQNRKLDTLIRTIEQAEINGRVGNPLAALPKWLKIAGLLVGGSVGLAGLLFVLLVVLAGMGILR